MFLSTTTTSRLVLVPTQPPIHWVLGALSLEVKWLGHEDDHSPQSHTKVKNAWSYTSTLPYFFMAWYLVKHRSNFTFINLGFAMSWNFEQFICVFPNWQKEYSFSMINNSVLIRTVKMFYPA
jgi:hypothetical protein